VSVSTAPIFEDDLGWSLVDDGETMQRLIDADIDNLSRNGVIYRATAVPTPNDARLALRSLSGYAVRRVVWLDKWFLQRAAFHLLAGRKGSLKGTLICGLSARVTRGDLYGEPKRVLVVTSEDSVELDFKPRVLAADGDANLVEIVTGDFLMPRDLDWLQQKALELGDVGLIAIDPIGNHLGGADTDKEGLVREAIKGLNPMADDLDCMIFGVRHLGKDVRRGALASVLGSTAWVDTPRCVILMAPDDEDALLFHAQVVAGNRGPRNHGRVYRLELVDVAPATEITLAVPQGNSTKDVEALLGVTKATSDTSKSALARGMILDLLDAAPSIESDELDSRIARETGLAAKTAKNIRSELRKEGLVTAYPDKDADGKVVRWLVRRTLATRPDQIPSATPSRVNPDPDSSETSAENPHKQATSPPVPLERVITGSGTHPPARTSEDPDLTEVVEAVRHLDGWNEPDDGEDEP
jgi:hypothetical protein